MTNEYHDYEAYWNHIQSSTYTRFEEILEEDEEVDENDLPWVIASDLTDDSHLVNYYKTTVIYHADNGFDGDGRQRYIVCRDFESDTSAMLHALASAGYYNDVQAAAQRIVETRNDLGPAMMLIDGYIYSEGVPTKYEYEKGVTDTETVEYRFEHIVEGEWRMIDPDGVQFEVISPSVIVKDEIVPEQKLKLWLDNRCAQRERERENDDE